VHEQATISCQERPIFAFHNVKQLHIIRLRIIGDIEAKQTQIAHKLSEMAICNKVPSGNSLQSLFLEFRNSCSYRIKFDIRVGPKRIMKIDGLPTNEDQIDFRMRHAARFDHILDRRFFA
jgi:hypothetical protein